MKIINRKIYPGNNRKYKVMTTKKTNLNIVYSNDNIRVFKLNAGYVVEGINKVFKKLPTAIRHAKELDLQIELSKIFLKI